MGGEPVQGLAVGFDGAARVLPARRYSSNEPARSSTLDPALASPAARMVQARGRSRCATSAALVDHQAEVWHIRR
jgi:hypothetical protein